MDSVVLERDQAVSVVVDWLATLAPGEKLTIFRTDGTIVISPEGDQRELLTWAEQIGNRYEDLFRRLAE